jgi:hypothetical protein
MIYDAQLREDRGLIPMDMLIGHFASLKLNDADEDELNFSSRGWKARKHPIHIERVRKANHELFDDPVVTKYLRHRIELEIRRDLRQESIGIELVHTCPTHAAHPGRNEKHIRILDHGSECRIRIFEHEFGVRMLLPRAQHRLLVGCEMIHRKLPLLLGESRRRSEITGSKKDRDFPHIFDHCRAAMERDELAPFHQQFLPCFEAEDSTAGDLLHCGISKEPLSAVGQKLKGSQ